MTKKELRQKLSDLIHKNGQVKLTGGALGDLQGCNAYEEETVKEGMWKTKYLGVSYWFKGITDNDIIDRVTITKRAFKEIIKLWPLRINKIIPALYSIYTCEGGLKSRVLKQENFCTACNELIETGLEIAARIADETLRSKVKDLIFCMAMFLQFSTTYRVWLQDILGELDKDKFAKSPLTEVLRLKRIFMGRLKTEQKKAEFLWRMVFLMVLVFKNKSMKFVEELDLEKIKLDTDDKYYCCRRSSYDFGGKSLWDRVKEAAIIDDENKNIILGI
jgi:hypothetical protein